ncbi:Uncharacterised protein [Mycobacterium tuberculosis]|uniref:Uncharacterized protein n=1 Tax=Mycobacterium tuberculosis TaxID=1773 RepID=A0A0U0U6X1_MYCTX|nr:Uncharacterised protein [Mycobacterium tuberculosis]COW91589.1 Uncharacterised protein [Mycobacterium tuberculosis]COY57438.1 Uncharacterised protein [Mycobacterium tuberculosis]
MACPIPVKSAAAAATSSGATISDMTIPPTPMARTAGSREP